MKLKKLTKIGGRASLAPLRSATVSLLLQSGDLEATDPFQFPDGLELSFDSDLVTNIYTRLQAESTLFCARLQAESTLLCPRLQAESPMFYTRS